MYYYLLYLTHPDLLLSLLNGVALLQDGDSLIDEGLGVFPVGIVQWHLGKSPQVLAGKEKYQLIEEREGKRVSNVFGM